MPDAWEAAAKKYQVETGATAGPQGKTADEGVSNPPNGGAVTSIDTPSNEDYKLWQQNDVPRMSQENGFQRAFDNLTTVTPEQEKGHSWLTNKAQEFGAGAIGTLSPLVHPIQTLSGAVDSIEHPKSAVISMAKSAEEHPAQTLGGLVGTLDTAGLGEAAGRPLMAAIPTRAKAGRLFEDVMNTAGDQPVKISPQTMKPLERTQQLAMAGGKPFGTADKLYQRIQTVNPITYREARDFAQNMSLSPEEKMSLKRSMRYEVPRMAKSFNEDVARAADEAGKGAEHRKAMSMYRTASRNAAVGKGLLKYGGRAALGAAGAGGLYELGKTLKQ